MNRLAIALSVYNNSKIDFNYEVIIIMMHLNHDANLAVKEYQFIDDSTYSDCTRGYLLLDFASHRDCEMAAQVLTFRGYKAA